MVTDYLSSVKKQFEYYKLLGEKTINQVPESKLFWQYNEDSNSIAIFVKHLSGNMISRWTDFLGHTVIEAINRQLPYHVGQMVFLGKMICGEEWVSLSIPRGKSDVYNAEKFVKPKHKEHFTDEFIEKNNGDC